MSNVIKVITQCNQIPPNSTVSKINGHIEYIIKEEIVVWGKPDALN